jgi:hypothetical protein
MDASTWCVGQSTIEKPLNIQSVLVFFQFIYPHNFNIQKICIVKNDCPNMQTHNAKCFVNKL